MDCKSFHSFTLNKNPLIVVKHGKSLLFFFFADSRVFCFTQINALTLYLYLVHHAVVISCAAITQWERQWSSQLLSIAFKKYWSRVHLTPLGAVILGSSSYSVVRSHNMSQPDLPAGSPSLVESVPRIFREYDIPHLQYK